LAEKKGLNNDEKIDEKVKDTKLKLMELFMLRYYK
jgi:hypothetical protein